MSLYLVTGGAGFIGSHIVKELVRRGQHVRILDDFSSGSLTNLKPVLRSIEVTKGDIRDASIVKRCCRNVDFVLHQAALASVERSLTVPRTVCEVNVNGTLNLLNASRNQGVKAFVYASSSSVYGDTPTLPKRETMPTRPMSPYAFSKLAGEQYLQLFNRAFGFRTVSLRYFNVFGPNQNPHSQYAAVIPRFIVAAMKGKRPTIFGDGRQTRDFTYISNVVRANLLACSQESASGGIYNIATGKRNSLLQLYTLISDSLKSNLIPVRAPARSGDVRHSLADISRAEQLLGYSVNTDFISGLKMTMEWYKENCN